MAKILSVNLENSLNKLSEVSEPSASKTRKKHRTLWYASPRRNSVPRVLYRNCPNV